jgi:CDP-glucose 4,6-dehydratase
MANALDRAFWRGRRVLLTGHTGFKGSWLALCLRRLGAHVEGLALAPDTNPSLYDLAGVAAEVPGGLADIRDSAAVNQLVAAAAPQIVFHLAAQPLVRRSVREPVATFATNVMGTVHLLEALRASERLEAVLVVTTDKVYRGGEGRPLREDDPLGAHDPYSSSKAAAEIVASAYAQTYFAERNIPVATARSGNVIGGGDFSEDRLVPDIYRAMIDGKSLVLRNPQATRPWHHVLDCVCGYLAYVEALAQRGNVPLALNFAPSTDAQVPVTHLTAAMQAALGVTTNTIVGSAIAGEPEEVQELTLDAGLAHETLGWSDRFDAHAAIKATADWYLALARGDDMGAFTCRSLEDHLGS